MANAVRILQLISSAAGYEARRRADALRDQAGSGFTTFRVDRPATLFGLWDAWRDVRRAVSAESCHVAHAFDAASLKVAVMAGLERIVVQAPAAPDVRLANYIRTAGDRHRIELVCPTATLCDFYLRRGVTPGRVQLIRVGVDFSRIAKRRNRELRAHLGFTDDDTVVLAGGESTLAAEHQAAAWACSLLHAVDRKYKLLLWRSPDYGILHNPLVEGTMAVRAEQRLQRAFDFEELLPAADLVLFTPNDITCTLPVAMAMAAALPIVTTVTPTICELLEDRHTALMISPPKPRPAAMQMLEILNNPALQWQLSDMAGTEAYEFFSQSRLLKQHRELYRQLFANAPIELSPPTQGGGARFHGLPAR